jgi:hypothetical protein
MLGRAISLSALLLMLATTAVPTIKHGPLVGGALHKGDSVPPRAEQPSATKRGLRSTGRALPWLSLRGGGGAMAEGAAPGMISRRGRVEVVNLLPHRGIVSQTVSGVCAAVETALVNPPQKVCSDATNNTTATARHEIRPVFAVVRTY